MNLQFEAARELHAFFSSNNISYCIIGGIALQHWGEPRFTQDVDATVLIAFGEEDKLLKKIFSAFKPRITDAFDFTLKNRVCLVSSSQGCPIDISFGIPGYEDEVMRRAVECTIGENVVIKICSAEDLIIHKAVAGRPKDLDDIESVIIRMAKKLDDDYIILWLHQFAELLEMPEITDRFQKPWSIFNK
jgi:hypothetical protein